MTEASANDTRIVRQNDPLTAEKLAARIMARMRGHHLLPPEGSEAQDEFEASHLTALLREALGD